VTATIASAPSERHGDTGLVTFTAVIIYALLLLLLLLQQTDPLDLGKAATEDTVYVNGI